MSDLEQGNGYRHSHPHHQHGPAMGLLNQRRIIRQVPGIVLGHARRAWSQAAILLIVLALLHVSVVSADTPAQTGVPTATPDESSSLPTPAAATPTPEAPGTPTPAPTATSAPPTATLAAVSQVTATPTATAPTPVPTTPVPATPLAPRSGTAHLSIRISDCVIPVGGTSSSEVLVLLRDVQPGIDGFHLSLRFDPQIVRLVDGNGNAASAVQVAPVTFLNPSQRVTENQVDHAAGKISLTLTQEGGEPVQVTSSWHKVATLTWAGQREGNSTVVISGDSYVTAGGQQFAPDTAQNGTLFVRTPGQIRGTVRLQGREGTIDALVTGVLTAARVDQVHTGADGRFALTPSHGEGFYTLSASAPGYLTATSHRPIKLTVGSAIDLGEVTLYGGDVTGDNRIDIRDLSMVAWHFDTGDARADLNGDGQVDILDLTLIAGNFGRVGPTVWDVPTAQ